MDFARMKAAHFNTIRTWEALDPEELALAKENGLMVLQGIRLDTKQDFSDPHNQQAAVAQVQSVAEKSKDFDNVLGYILMTEPSPQAVLETGDRRNAAVFPSSQTFHSGHRSASRVHGQLAAFGVHGPSRF